MVSARTSSKDGIAASASTSYVSYFDQRTDGLATMLDDDLHRILHGCAEPLPEDLKTAVRKSLVDMTNNISTMGGGISGISSSIWELDGWGILGGCKEFFEGTIGLLGSVGSRAKDLAQGVANTALAFTGSGSVTAVNKVFDMLPGGSEKKDELIKGMASQREMHDVLDGQGAASSSGQPASSSAWDPRKHHCTEGILHCTLLGVKSKAIIRAMLQFTQNIKGYEQKKHLPFFKQQGVDRVYDILLTALGNLSALNITSALEKQQPDEKHLDPCLQLMQRLVAIPTTCHDPRQDFEKNRAKVNETLKRLPLPLKRRIREFYGVLSQRAHDPTYAHIEGDAGTNLICAGSTATGKTWTAGRTIRFAGFPVIEELTLDDLLDTPPVRPARLLIKDGTVSRFEDKFLQLAPGKTKGIGFLNLPVFIDEVYHNQFDVGKIKQKLDQFKHIYLPSLGLEIPGFLHCIFGTNDDKLTSIDPALAGRFALLYFPEFLEKDKIGIIWAAAQIKLSNCSYLMQAYDEQVLKDKIAEYVRFDPKANLRVLLGNLDAVFLHLAMQLNADEDDIFTELDENGNRESFQEFLESKIGKTASTEKFPAQRSFRAQTSTSSSKVVRYFEDSSSSDNVRSSKK